jgi:hypothetical protein
MQTRPHPSQFLSLRESRQVVNAKRIEVFTAWFTAQNKTVSKKGIFPGLAVPALTG